MQKYVLVCSFLLIAFSTKLCAQSGEIINKKEQKRILEEGEYYYEEENYVKALEYFKKLEEVDPNDLYYKLVIGICYSYKVDEKSKSIQYLESVKELNPEFNEVNLYLGRAYSVNQRFSEAIDVLEIYLQDESVDDELAEKARMWIDNSRNGQELVADSVDVVIKNVGSVVNSEDAEYVPLITPDESKLIFTYRGPKSKGEPDKKGGYFEDIYISYKSPDDWMYDEDVWLEPESIEAINTDNDDACIAITIDGQKLFLYKYEKANGGDIYISQLDGKIWSEPIKLEGDVNSKYWEGSVAISSDEQELYFASDRPGGFGGRDLYKAEKLPDGTWGNVQNLGPDINTPYHDDSPFIQIDKQTLFYSSQGHNSMGGYDIFFSKREGDNWSAPKNLGYPINSVEDDRYFVINASGRKGFYSSDGLNSIGDQDIYYVELDPERIGIKSIAALIIGTVYADEQPAKAEISIVNVTLGSQTTKFNSNSETGNYGIALAPGFEYGISYSVDGYKTHTDSLDLRDLEDYIEVSNNVYIYSDKFLAENNITPPEPELLQKLTDSAIVEAKKVPPSTLAAKTPPDGIPPVTTPPGTTTTPLAITTPNGGTETPEVEVTPVTSETSETGGVVVAVTDTLKEQEKEEIAVIPPPPPPPTEIKGDQPCDDEFVDLSAFVGKDLNDIAVYNDLLGVVGNYCADDLVFRVQIGAYRFPQNFKYPELDKFGNAEITDYPDGITRFTMGEYITLKDADALRQKIIAAGRKDAWVVPFFEGKRMFMEDMIKVNFYNRSIN